MREWLISKRKELKLTQQEVAKGVGVTRQMISAIENGDSAPSVDTAKSLGKILNFPWTQFFDAS